MITDHYLLEATPDKRYYVFESIGKQGVFHKVIWFQETRVEGVINLALCVYSNGKLEDDFVTNNQDFVKTISTVALAVYDYFDTYPDAIVEIGAIGEKRLRIYNGIFQRKYVELATKFFIYGIKAGVIEPYSPSTFYEKFELRLKKS